MGPIEIFEVSLGNVILSLSFNVFYLVFKLVDLHFKTADLSQSGSPQTLKWVLPIFKCVY